MGEEQRSEASDAVPVLRLDARFRNVGGQLLLADAVQAFELTDSAAFVMRKVDGRRSLRDIGALLAEEFDIDVDTATEDVAELLDSFTDTGLLSYRASGR